MAVEENWSLTLDSITPLFGISPVLEITVLLVSRHCRVSSQMKYFINQLIKLMNEWMDEWMKIRPPNLRCKHHDNYYKLWMFSSRKYPYPLQKGFVLRPPSDIPFWKFQLNNFIMSLKKIGPQLPTPLEIPIPSLEDRAVWRFSGTTQHEPMDC